MRKQAALWLMIGAVAGWAADPATVQYWSASALQSTDKKLAAKTDPKSKSAVEQLGNAGNRSFVVVHREGNGEAEIHEGQTDVMVVQSGQATLVVGGKVKDAKTTAPGEVRGTAIEGGREIKVLPGDVVDVPYRTPHQMLVAPGGAVTYLIVKVDSPEKP